jgi:hypothetical protein
MSSKEHRLHITLLHDKNPVFSRQKHFNLSVTRSTETCHRENVEADFRRSQKSR